MPTRVEKMISQLKSKKDREEAALIYSYFTRKFKPEELRVLLTEVLARPKMAYEFRVYMMYKIEKAEAENG